MRRFVMHILPKGFTRVRHYGFLANRCREKKVAAMGGCWHKRRVMSRQSTEAMGTLMTMIPPCAQSAIRDDCLGWAPALANRRRCRRLADERELSPKPYR